VRATSLLYLAGCVEAPRRNVLHASSRGSGYFHHAYVTGLQPDTRYYVLPTQNGTHGIESSFVTGKPLGADVATRFVHIADMHITAGEGAAATCKFLTQRITESDDIDWLLHVGDLGYGRGNTTVWNTWHELISPFSSRVPYHVSIGNHEFAFLGLSGANDPSGVHEQWAPSFSNVYNDGGGECGVPTTRRFKTPLNGNAVFWYSFEVGPVHVALISSEHDPSPDAPMGAWLEDDLMGVDRSVTPWLIVAAHRPLVMTQNYPPEEKMAAGLYKIMEPLLIKAKVDLLLTGHIHSMQRSCAMFNYSCTKPGEHGVVHYMNGAGACYGAGRARVITP